MSRKGMLLCCEVFQPGIGHFARPGGGEWYTWRMVMPGQIKNHNDTARLCVRGRSGKDDGPPFIGARGNKTGRDPFS